MSSRLSRVRFAVLASVGLLCASCDSCRRPTASAHDDASRSDTGIAALPDVADVHVFGPPNEWGDGALPVSTATGPEVDATRARMTAARASIGFWRLARDARGNCPTIEDLAATASAVFDRGAMGTDAWGTPLEIDCQGTSVHVRSLGPDRRRATPDDIIEQ